MTVTEQKTVPIYPVLNKRFEQTLKKEVSFSGIGIHTGELVEIRFVPAPAGTGIVFRRIDLPQHPEIPAHINYVVDTARCTILGINEIRIYTVEHVLAALKAYNIDNLIIELDNIEPPVGNGSADIFVSMIENAGIETLAEAKPIYAIDKPLYYSSDEISIVALPSENYRISYTLSYPKSKLLQSQYFALNIEQQTFKTEIAPNRTFSFYEEVKMLMDRGLIKGGSLNNAVIIMDEVILSKGGLFFPNEMVRHKILDMIGDLSLVGYDFHAHIISIRSGHSTNCLFAKKLYESLNMEKC